MNCTFLIALGAIWGHLEFPPRIEKAAPWSALYGTYGNWLFTKLGAAMSTAAATPSCRRAITESNGKKELRGRAFAAFRIRSSSPSC